MQDPSAPLAKKQRLGVKTPALHTNFPTNRLVDKVEHKRLKAIEREAEVKRRRLDKRAGVVAARAIQLQPSLANAVDELDTGSAQVEGANETAVPFAELRVGNGIFDIDDMRALHPSHDLRRMATHDITYCNTCGKWAQHNLHSQLTDRCEPINRGKKHALRLLQLDVIPLLGAKIPSSARLKSGRKRGA